jgi:hypothetical protein
MQPVDDDSRVPFKIRFDLSANIAKNFAIFQYLQ